MEAYEDLMVKKNTATRYEIEDLEKIKIDLKIKLKELEEKE